MHGSQYVTNQFDAHISVCDLLTNLRRMLAAKFFNSSHDFKITILENPLLPKQAVTSKGIPVPYTNLQLNPYPNTQLDLFCSDNLSF